MFSSNFRKNFRFLSLFLVRLVDNFAFSFLFNPTHMWIVESEKSGFVSAMTTYHKIRFSEVHLYGPIRLIGKSAFMLVPFYPNQCRLLGGPYLGELLVKNVGLSCLLEAGSN